MESSFLHYLINSSADLLFLLRLQEPALLLQHSVRIRLQFRLWDSGVRINALYGSARLGSALQQQEEAFLNNQSQGKIQTSWLLSRGAGSTFTQQPEPDWEPELQRELQKQQVWMDLRENMGFWSVTQPHNLCPDTGPQPLRAPHLLGPCSRVNGSEFIRSFLLIIEPLQHFSGGTGSPHAGTHLKNQEYVLGMLVAPSAASWRGAGSLRCSGSVSWSRHVNCEGQATGTTRGRTHTWQQRRREALNSLRLSSVTQTRRRAPHAPPRRAAEAAGKDSGSLLHT
eukprot:XP_011612702.1 PREDICTED: uncharacterized protein LOC105417882 isoform X1 [Takifugu rubripes]